MKGLSIVIPVLNESHKILRSLKSKLEEMGAEVIVVDDGSKRSLPEAVKHGVNFGYGAAILTGIKQAKNEVIMTMDGDLQHFPDEANKLYQAYLLMNKPDMLIGSRRLDYEKPIRFLGRKLLNWTASFISGKYLQDLNSGMRIFKKSIAMGYSSILCKEYSFTTSITMSYLTDGYRVEWFPIKVGKRKFGSSKVKLLRHGLTTLWYILWIGLALRTRGLRSIYRSLFKRKLK